jgi:hypothetical protein
MHCPLPDQLHIWLNATLEVRSKKCDPGWPIPCTLNRCEALTWNRGDCCQFEIDDPPLASALRGQSWERTAVGLTVLPLLGSAQLTRKASNDADPECICGMLSSTG